MKYFKSILFALALLFALGWTEVWAQTIPQMIPYTGTIEVNGTPFNGNGQFKFAIVSGDGSLTYWSNDNTSVAGSEPTAFVTLPVNEGVFTVKLGDVSLANMLQPIPIETFDSDQTYLRVWFNDGVTGFQQLTPDRQLVSVPYAYRAQTAEQVPSLSASGTINAAGNPVDWTKLKGVPAGFADGVDDTGGGGGAASDVVCTGCVDATDIADGTIATGDLSFDPATQVELDAHKTSGDHDSRYYLKSELNTLGTINAAGNPVDWTKLKGVPAGFADGVDDTGGGGGPASDVVCTGCVDSTDIADTTVATGDLAFDPATQTELDSHTGATSVHSATSANTASRIVIRDASGNFSAGAITASLVGNASTASGLAADPADCVGGYAAPGINASGAAVGCFDVGTQAELDTHKTSADHDGRYYTETELNTSDGDGPNVGSNRVHWNNLNGVPAGFADGTDDTGGGSLPSGTSGQTLRHDGTNWVANSLLFNNGTNVGIGTTGPISLLDIASNSAGGATYTATEATPSGASGGIVGQKARGNLGTPTAVLANDNLFALLGRGHDGSVYSGNKVAILFKASENFSATNQGTYITFETTPNASTSRAERIRIDNTGNVGIGTTGPGAKLDVAGTVRLGTSGVVFTAIKTFTDTVDFPSTATDAESWDEFALPEDGAIIGVLLPVAPLDTAFGYGGSHRDDPSGPSANITFSNWSGGDVDPAPATFTVYYIAP